MKRLRTCMAFLIATLILSVSVAPPSVHSPRVLLTRAHASVDASSTWDSCCANFEFPSTATTPATATFADAWNSVPNHTMTFADAFRGIQSYVSNTMGMLDPGFGDGELMNASIQNWPDE